MLFSTKWIWMFMQHFSPLFRFYICSLVGASIQMWNITNDLSPCWMDFYPVHFGTAFSSKHACDSVTFDQGKAIIRPICFGTAFMLGGCYSYLCTFKFGIIQHRRTNAFFKSNATQFWKCTRANKTIFSAFSLHVKEHSLKQYVCSSSALALCLLCMILISWASGCMSSSRWSRLSASISFCFFLSHGLLIMGVQPYFQRLHPSCWFWWCAPRTDL